MLLNEEPWLKYALRICKKVRNSDFISKEIGGLFMVWTTLLTYVRHKYQAPRAIDPVCTA